MEENDRLPPEPPPSGDVEPSVLLRIEQSSGARSRVHLRDTPQEPSPVLRIHAEDEPETIQDDTRYQVFGEIARGGVGVIFKCRDKDLGRDVALKVLRRIHLESDEVIQRFVEEAQIGGQLQHPGIVPIYGLGLQEDGRPFFAMKLVKGRTLAAQLEGRESPSEDRRQFLATFEQVCQTMAYAHARGVIHRDLKPANIMVGAFGEVQVMDWGFSKVLGARGEDDETTATTGLGSPIDEQAIATVRSSGDGSRSLAGAVMGTPTYMPPEQALGRVDEIDERCDVFSLGALLCEILTGQAPYDASGKDALFMAAQGRLEEAFERLEASDADEELVELARRCLQPERKERPRDAGAVARAVSRHLADVEERTRKGEIRAAQARAKAKREQARADREIRRRRRGLISMATLFLALLIGGGAYLWVDRHDRERHAQFGPEIHNALRNAQEHRRDNEWQQAKVAAATAYELAMSGGVGSELLDEVTGFRDELADAEKRWLAAREQEERDTRVVAALLDAGACRSPSASARDIEQAYLDAFRGFGIDFAKLTPAEAQAKLSAGNVHTELCAALDDWLWIRRTEPDLQGSDWRRLEATLKRADPNPWRNRLRAAASTASPVLLAALVGGANERAPRENALLGFALLRAGDPERAVSLLRRAQSVHAGSLWIQLRLGQAALHLDPPDLEGAKRAYTAAMVMHPGCMGVRQQLATLMVETGDYDQALGELGSLARLEGGPRVARAWLARTREQTPDAPPAFDRFQKQAHQLLAGGG